MTGSGVWLLDSVKNQKGKTFNLKRKMHSCGDRGMGEIWDVGWSEGVLERG